MSRRCFHRAVVMLAAAVVLAGCSLRTAEKVDVLVVGGGTSGVAAGLQSARMGARTFIIEETDWLGGMLTAAGVSAVDGNYRLRAGIWGEFLDSLVMHYGGSDSLKTGWVSNVLFEPAVGNDLFHRMAAAEPLLTVKHGTAFVDARREKGRWIVRTEHAGKTETVEARVLIDATEQGDVARALGVPYDIGMESREATDEDIAPETANGIVQDLTYVAILKDYGHDVRIARPEDYDPALFACCCANPLCTNPREPNRVWSKEMMMSYGRLPGGKIMINWPIEGNDYYTNMIDLSREEREAEIAKAKHRTLCYLYFLQNELGLTTLGLDDETFPTEDRLPLIPYHRESRRIHGKVRFNLNHAMHPYEQPEPLYRTCIAVGDYPVDHHHTRYTGADSLPDLHFHPVPSYGVPLGALIPADRQGLIVAEKSISVSNIMNGSTRLQPVVLQIGQAAGALAALAVKQGCTVDEVQVREVQRAVLDAGGYLLPYLDVPKDSPYFKPLQRIGSTGILRGEGRNVDWSNETWIHADFLLRASDLHCLAEYGMNAPDDKALPERTVSIAEAVHIVTGTEMGTVWEQVEAIVHKYAWSDCDTQRPILRKEFAVLADELCNPFARAVNIKGESD